MKTCSICNLEKEESLIKKIFSGSSQMYCEECANKHRKDIFIISEDGQFLEAVSKETSNEYFIKGFGYFLDKKHMRFYSQKTRFKIRMRIVFFKSKQIEMIDANRCSRGLIDKKLAKRYIREGAGYFLDEKTIVNLHTKSSLYHFVKNRESNKCFYCENEGTRLVHLKTYSQEGLDTPGNCRWTCSDCFNRIHPYVFSAWLDKELSKREVLVSKIKSLFSSDFSVYKLFSKDGKGTCFVDKKTALSLIEGRIVETISTRKIRLLYTHAEFKEELLKRDSYLCFYCGNPGKTIDHLHPRTEGGLTTFSNCVCACKKCNEEKSSQSVSDFLSKEKSS